MESRFVLTAKPLEPQDDADSRQGQLLLDWYTDEPCKAKARHVMKGFSEDGSGYTAVTREGALLVTQMIVSNRWQLGFLDFSPAFHSGDPIQRTVYAEQPREGIPGMPSQVFNQDKLICLLKVCYGLSDGPLARFKHLHRVLVEKLHSLAGPCILYKHNQKTDSLSGITGVATNDLLHGGDREHQECIIITSWAGFSLKTDE